MGGSALNAIGEQISAILWNVFNRPRLIDLIDILLLTIIIYELLVHVRQTRVSQTIKGIIILLIATWLSDVLGMRTIHALLAWMINAGPVLLIVLFQSEIRRILEELGNNSVFDSSTALVQAGNAELIIDEMILALEHMARRKVGALIVIENKIRLNDVIATGTRVDGVISQPLIENIFEPNTPLHDGAVVVRGDRVIAAACLLRLSDTTGVGRDLGTRHRAGLGVSEISDAKVFIVSEETGIISMAEGGRLVRHLDEASLRQILHGIYDAQDKDARVPLLHFKQRRMIAGVAASKPFLITVSALAAVVCWSALVASDGTLTRQKTFANVAVTVTGEAALKSRGYIVMDDILEKVPAVKMTVEVTQANYNRVSGTAYNPHFDLSQITGEGENELSVTYYSSQLYGPVVNYRERGALHHPPRARRARNDRDDPGRAVSGQL